MMRMPMKAVMTMTSMEIAELVESRHNDVMKSVRRLAARGVIEEPQRRSSSYINNLGYRVPTPLYVFEGERGKRDSTVVVAQLCPEFTARLVDRWQELEERAAQPRLPDFTNPAEAARAWADELEQRQIAQAALEEAKPKVAAYDEFSSEPGSYCITDAAKRLGVKPKRLFDWLESNRWIYRRTKKGRWVACQPRLTSGFLAEKPITDEEGQVVFEDQVRATRKGLFKLGERKHEIEPADLMAKLPLAKGPQGDLLCH